MKGERTGTVDAAPLAAPDTPEGTLLLVDVAANALRKWLASGRHRPGERLPPEHELAAQLGISRGTLRTALKRLEEGGEIIRRQGSGTFVGRTAPTVVAEGFERLVSYRELAERQGVKLEIEGIELEERRVGRDLGDLFGVEPDAATTTIGYRMLLDGKPGLVTNAVLSPAVSSPPSGQLRRGLERKESLVEILLAHGVEIAYAVTRLRPRLLTPREPLGVSLRLGSSRAALELESEYRTGEGMTVQQSLDVFVTGALDLWVVRELTERPPVPTIVRDPLEVETPGRR